MNINDIYENIFSEKFDSNEGINLGEGTLKVENTSNHDGKFRNERKKELWNLWGILTSDLIDDGNCFYALTINTYEGGMTDSFLNDDFEYDDNPYYKLYINKITTTIYNNFPTTSLFFIVPERNKKGLLHFHCLLSIRNFIDYNLTLRNNINYVLVKYLDLYSKKSTDQGIERDGIMSIDIKTKCLFGYVNISNWIKYLHKDMFIWKNFAYIYYLISLDFKDNNYLINRIYCNYYSLSYMKVTYHKMPINVKVRELPENLYSNIKGVILRENTLNENTLISIIQYYLILNNLFLYKGDIYKKIKDSRISYKLIGSVVDVLYTNFQENVMSFYSFNFKYYFKGFDFDFLIKSYLYKSKNPIKNTNDITTNRIELDFSICEFKDGVYSIKYNRFFPNSEGCVFTNVSTIKYYDKSYEWTRKNRPEVWLSNVLFALGVEYDKEGKFEQNEIFLTLCFCLSNAFHGDILKKRKLMHLHGLSNSGKTTLFVDFLTNYFTVGNIGTISGSSEFKWEDLLDKIIGIVDEYKHNSKNLSNINMIVNNEVIKVPRKYKSIKAIKPLNAVYLIGNKPIIEYDCVMQETINNRMYKIQLLNKIRGDKNLKKNIYEEEARIVLYLNKLLFKQNEVKRLNNRINNCKVLELININENTSKTLK